jgi:hypothetical protein
MNPIPCTYQTQVSYCLQVLNSYPAGAAVYILSRLSPESFTVIMTLVHLDLNQPHQHTPASEQAPCLPCSVEDLLQDLQAVTGKIPTQDYDHFWLELTEKWLLTCPVDSSYYRVDDTGKELFCQILRSELLDRILDIN